MDEAFQPGGRAPAPGSLALVQDFVNTEIPDWNRDDVSTPEELGAWLADRGLAEAADTVDGDLFVKARALRATLRELALANTTSSHPGRRARRTIDETLSAFPLAVRFRDDGPALEAGGSGAARGLATIVAAVVAARADGTWGRLKACKQETCGWLFYDASRNRSSSWCSMQICGGREKARAYRRRRGDT